MCCLSECNQNSEQRTLFLIRTKMQTSIQQKKSTRILCALIRQIEKNSSGTNFWRQTSLLHRAANLMINKK